jgi:hypothetical protein
MCEPNQIACATLAGSGVGFECVNVADNARESSITYPWGFSSQSIVLICRLLRWLS